MAKVMFLQIKKWRWARDFSATRPLIAWHILRHVFLLTWEVVVELAFDSLDTMGT